RLRYPLLKEKKGTNMNQTFRPGGPTARGRRRHVLTLLIAFAVIVLGMSPRVFAQIQLDGDAKKSTGATGAGTDWDEINCPNATINCVGLTAGGSSIAKTGLVSDQPEPAFAQFTGGGSKDEQDVPNWRFRSGNPVDKDDLSHAFAAAFRGTGARAGHT